MGNWQLDHLGRRTHPSQIGARAGLFSSHAPAPHHDPDEMRRHSSIFAQLTEALPAEDSDESSDGAWDPQERHLSMVLEAAIPDEQRSRPPPPTSPTTRPFIRSQREAKPVGVDLVHMRILNGK